ncbi:MAG: rod shape-determining protein MreD [Sandaracinus sp.]|nr:rod shape-determining protein MreD [Sandaracinus sp.]MCB9623552.1 rod shape-determining protein MreD [Sandaracinus sp.]
MESALRMLAVVALGLGLLVLQSVFVDLVSLHPFAPNLILPIVLFLGVAPDVPLVRGALLAFTLGYVLDVFSGNRMGLETFVCVATFMAARGAGLRLFLRSPSFQMALALVVSLLAGGTTLALRAIFSTPAPFPGGDALGTALLLGASSIATAICAPVVFALVRRIELRIGRRREAAEV